MRLTGILVVGAFGLAPAAAIAADVSVERGKQVSIIGGCHDCHTEGYTESGGQIDPAKALKGIAIGWMGPWGTTYASNLRTEVRFMSEDGFVGLAKMRLQPPMPWYNLRAMDESDIRSLYRYIKSLGDPGEPVPADLGPGQEPKTPYVVIAPPTMPKGVSAK